MPYNIKPWKPAEIADAKNLVQADYAKAEEHVLSTMSPQAKKAFSFGVLYGGNPTTLAENMGLKISFPHAKLCTLLQIDDPLITTEVAKAGWLLSYNNAMSRFTWQKFGKAQDPTIPFPVKEFDKLVKGTCNPMILHKVRVEVLDAILPAIKAMGLTPAVLHPQNPQKPMSKGIMGMLPKEVANLAHKPAPPSPSPVIVTETGPAPVLFQPIEHVYPLSELADGPTVKLREATKMYQPVQGTGSTTRYHVVAMGHGVLVAARYIEGNLSIRIEGDQYAKHVPAITNFGFSHVSPGHTMNAYASMHLPCPSEGVAAKALGAVIIGLGIPFVTPMPSLKVFAGKGK